MSPLLTKSGQTYTRCIDVREFAKMVQPLHLTERRAVESAMILCNGNRNEAARRLGIALRTLMRKLAEYRTLDDC